jgi:FKBP-type peptidyl-prolyl cis-trans isomerase SlyD
MEIKNNYVVHIHYKLTNNQGEVLDSSEGREPLAYLQGAGNIIPGLESELLGKVKGDQLTVVVQPENGYGMPRPELIQQIPVAEMNGVDKVEEGMQLQAQTPQGPIPIMVKAVENGIATLDANHPLAGEVLNFDVTVEEVREATAEEIEHKHAH